MSDFYEDEYCLLSQGDCLEKMKDIPDGSIDMILTDPPYGTTACKWDTVIPFEPMWEQLNRIIKPNGAIVLFGSEPFSSHIRLSNLENYKYDWVWQKSMASGMATSSFMPMKYHENISVFVQSGKPTYNPQLMERAESGKARSKYKNGSYAASSKHISIANTPPKQYNPEKVLPKSCIFFNSVPNTPKGSKLHPTQKPVELLKYLIRTYTNEGETVLDFTCGSGSTGVAAKQLGRRFIGIEKDTTYFEIAKKRIQETPPYEGANSVV